MSVIHIFVQVEGREGVVATEMPSDVTWAQLVKHATKVAEWPHGQALVVSLEDAEGEIEPVSHLSDICKVSEGVRVHLHRCRHVAVSVNYAGRPFEKKFSGGTTIAKIKKTAGAAFGISEKDLAELVLEIAGTNKRPDPDVHVGTLATHPHCSVAFNLVFTKRVQG